MLLETHSSIAGWLGLCGDVLTFAGGAILAIDATQQEERFKRVRDRVRTYLESPELLKLDVSVDGIVVKSEDDVELPFIRHSALAAKLGFILLTVGLAFLLSVRIIEISGRQSHEKMGNNVLDSIQ